MKRRDEDEGCGRNGGDPFAWGRVGARQTSRKGAQIIVGRSSPARPHHSGIASQQRQPWRTLPSAQPLRVRNGKGLGKGWGRGPGWYPLPTCRAPSSAGSSMHCRWGPHRGGGAAVPQVRCAHVCWWWEVKGSLLSGGNNRCGCGWAHCSGQQGPSGGVGHGGGAIQPP